MLEWWQHYKDALVQRIFSFVISPPESSVLYAGNYDFVLVSLSIGIAIFASYAALLVSQHVATTTIVTVRRMWIACGGLCLGVGIWAMHFVGMLAFSLPCSTSYDATVTFLSVIPGILASTLAIRIISRRELSHAQLALGGLLLGAGIGAMHYAGMAAMRLNGLIRYDITLFLLSVFVAIALATLALWIKFRLRKAMIASAVMMGLAVSGMHYTAMAAAYFIRDDGATLVASGVSPTFLATIVLVITSLIVCMTIVAIYFSKVESLLAKQPYKLIGLLLLGWVSIAWLSADYYYGHRGDNLYQRESQLAKLQVEIIASHIGDDVALLKGISLVASRDDDTYRALRRFGANVAPSSLAYEKRKQRWTRDGGLGELNDTLHIATSNLGADNIFVINAAGDCIAAGNADKPGSPVGTNFADRLYFPQVQSGHPGHQYAVGRTTNIPGLYYAAPVFEKGRFIGAVVVKRDITHFSNLISQDNAFIADANGVIILTPDKRLELSVLPDASIGKLSAEKVLQQYKRSVLVPLEITSWGNTRFPSVVFLGNSNSPVILASKNMPEDAVTIYVSRPVDELVHLDTEKSWLFILISSVGSMLIIAVSTVMVYLREKRTQRELLRKSEEQTRLLLDSAAEGIYGVDIQGNCTFVNAAFLRILGYQDADEILGKHIHELIHYARADGSRYPAEECRMYQAFRCNEKIQVGDEVFWRRDGSAFPVEYWSYPIVRDGQVAGAVATFFDITERKQAEQELREMGEHTQSLLRLSRKLEYSKTYADVLNAAHDEVKSTLGYQHLWVYLFTEDKKYAKVLIAGGPASDPILTGEGIATLSIEGDRFLEELAEAREIVVVEDARTDERTNKEIVAQLGNRTIVNVPIFMFDHHLGLVGTGTFGDEGMRVPTQSEREFLTAMASHLAVTLDRIHLIAESKQAEAQLKNSEERHRQIIQTSMDGFWVTDTRGHILDVNDAYCQMIGYTREELLNMHISDVDAQESTEETARHIREIMAQGHARFETRHRCKAGQLLEVAVSVVLQQDNASGHFFVFVRDITHRMQAQRALQQQLMYAKAINHISEILLNGEDLALILEETTRIVGMTLCADRSLIYDISFKQQLIIGLSEWLNPQHPDISITKGTYPLSVFSGGASAVRDTKTWFASHDDAINPNLIADGSGEILHHQMKIKSLLWYPFAFGQDGFYLLVLNQVCEKKEWTQAEIDFLDSVSYIVNVELEKIRLFNERKQMEAINLRRLDELSALYQLSNAVGNAQSLDETYEAAKDSILSALKADRASILFFDAEGVMRFQSWHGLSDVYRKLTEGHSPWTQDVVNPEPILIDDIELDTDWAHFRPVAAAEGIRSFGFIPLVQKGRLLGKFMIYYNSPHHFVESEIRLAKTIAFHIAFAIARKQAEAAISKASQRLQIALEGSQISVWELDTSTNEVWLDASWAKYLGNPPAESHIAFTKLLDMVHPEDRKSIIDSSVQCLKGEIDRYVVEHRVMSANGKWFWILSRGQVTERDSTGRALRVSGTNTNITDRKLDEQELRIAATAFESQEGMLITDAGGVIMRVNKAFSDITGYPPEEVIGKNPSIFKSGRQDAHFYAAMWARINNAGVWGGEIWNQRKNGEIYPEYLTITSVRDSSGIITNYVATFSDITERKSAEDEIKSLAFYDPLTRLPNRRLLLDRLHQALASGARNGREGALLFIDLDNFKILNDTLGHDIGDLLLQQVAKRLESCVREGDTVARLGGDEFVVMLEDLSEHVAEAAAQTKAVGEKIITMLNQPYQLATHTSRSTPSIGATLFAHHESMDELFKQADIAMYQAKKAGRNTLRFFDSVMQDAINTRAMLEEELHTALENQQFQLHYQIQVDSALRIIGVEALLRWAHPVRGMIPPSAFIPLAEETDLILPIGEWVLHTACAQIKRWSDSPVTRHLRIAVNVSSVQFAQDGFVAQVQRALVESGIDPACLKLELTESMMLNNVDDTIVKMHQIREFGVGFSMDDFGTGFSSLSYLKKLPLDQLKIDQSFVHDLVLDHNDNAIVEAIITMGEAFGLSIIAEGVETETQRALLSQNGCNTFQGYLFGKPMPINQLDALLETDHHE